MLAIFDRAEARDFVDLAELANRFPLKELIALARQKDPGLDLAVLEDFMDRPRGLPPAEFGLDQRRYAQLLDTVGNWQVRIRHLRRRERNQDGSSTNGEDTEPEA